MQQSVRRRKCDCRAINNNAAVRKPALILVIAIPRPALVTGERNIQKWLGFWARHKEQLHGIRRMEAAPTKRFRQHLKDVSHSSEKCSSQLPARRPVWRSVSASLQTAGKSCGYKPVHTVWIACSVSMFSGRASFPLREATWNQVGLAVLCWVSVTMSHAPPKSWDGLGIKGFKNY